ncbi:regulatory phage cox family protein [Mannheimia haemolytica]
MEQPIVIQIGASVPAMTYEKFAECVGMSKEWVQDQVEAGNIPIMPKKGREKPLINLAKYWQIAFSQPY